MDLAKSELLRQQCSEVHIFPAEFRSVDHNAGFAVHHSGDHQAYSVTQREGGSESCFSESFSCLPTKGVGELLWLKLCRETHDLTDLLTDSVRDHHERTRRPHIESDRDPSIRVDVKECWFP